MPQLQLGKNSEVNLGSFLFPPIRIVVHPYRNLSTITCRFHMYWVERKKKTAISVVLHWTQHLMQSFKLIAAIAECSDRVHVEGILSLTYGSDSLFQPRQVDLLIGLSAVVWGTIHTKQAACWDVIYHTLIWSPSHVQKYSPSQNLQLKLQTSFLFIYILTSKLENFVAFFFCLIKVTIKHPTFCIFKC